MATGGAAWVTLDSLGSKVLATLTQIILAQILFPEHFGLFALAFAVVGFSEFASRTGIRDIIIRRHKEYDTIGGSAFWMAGGLGIVSSLLIIAVAPFAAMLYEEPRVQGVLYVAAIAPIITAFGIVPKTRLETQLKYRTLAVVHWTAAIARVVVSVALAWAGLGVYALVIGLLSYTAVDSLSYLLISKLPRDLRFRFAQVRGMWSDMSTLYVTGLMSAVITHGDYFLLGKFADAQEVGYYFVAYTLGLQVVLMFGMNIGRVLQPAMAQILDDPERQSRAFLAAMRVLLLIGVPICCLQAGLAGGLVRAFLRPEYAGAVLPLAILSAGMVFRLMSFFAMPTLKAQGRFKAVLLLQAINATQLMVLAGFGAWLGGATGCAVGIAIGSIIAGFMMSGAVLRYTGAGFRGVAGAVFPPAFCGAIAGLVAFVPALFLPADRIGGIAHVIIGGTAGCLCYYILARFIMPARLADAAKRTEHLWKKLPMAEKFSGILVPNRVRMTGGGGR